MDALPGVAHLVMGALPGVAALLGALRFGVETPSPKGEHS